MVARAKFIARLMIATGRRRASWGLKAKGRTYAKDEDLSALFRIVTPGYLSAMGTHLRDGRDFSWQNGPKDQPMVINRVPGRRFWPAENPLGRMAIINQRDVRVVGVISDVRKNSLEVSAAPEMYLPVMQADPEGAELVVRSKLPPAAVPASVMKILRALNPAQPAAELRPLRPIVDRAVSPRRLFVMLVASFAVVGLVLAAVGIYGVISYSVTRQKHEIGMRMTLGVTESRVQFDVVAKALGLAVIGIALGTAGSLAPTKWIASLLFNMEPNDPLTFSGIIVLLAMGALVAGYIPARRASRIDPMIVLRAN